MIYWSLSKCWEILVVASYCLTVYCESIRIVKMITFVFCQKCNYFCAMNVTLIVHSKLEILLSAHFVLKLLMKILGDKIL